MNPTDKSQKNYHLSYPKAVCTVLTPGFKKLATQTYLTVMNSKYNKNT